MEVQKEEPEVVMVVGREYCGDKERELTVQKTSSFYPGDGFDAFDQHTGDLVFRVDTYDHRPVLAADQLVLMNAAGTPILTVLRKWPSLHQRWEGFLGDRHEGQKHLFTVRRSSMFGGSSSAAVSIDVHGEASPAAAGEYRVEGSFAQRCCRVIYEGTGAEVEQEETAPSRMVAVVKRKVDDECAQHAMMGGDVFCLSLRPGFDAAFAMGVIIVLDQISGGVDVNSIISDAIEGGGDEDDDEDH